MKKGPWLTQEEVQALPDGTLVEAWVQASKINRVGEVHHTENGLILTWYSFDRDLDLDDHTMILSDVTLPGTETGVWVRQVEQAVQV